MKTPPALLIIGNQPHTIEAAATAIVKVLGAAPTEAAQVAAVHCLGELARAPANTSISGCNFTSEQPVAGRKR
jgi:hypothetical protein